MAIKGGELVKTIMGLGVSATINDILDQETAILAVEEACKKDDKSEIDKSVEELSKVAQPLSSKLYKSDQPESEPDKGEGKSDEAVDAEFKEVDEEKDKS